MYCVRCGNFTVGIVTNFCATCGTPIHNIDTNKNTIKQNDISAVPVNNESNSINSSYKLGILFFLVIILIVGFFSLTLINECIENRNKISPITTDDGDKYNIQYEWNFKGYSWEYSTEIPKSQYEYYSNKPRSRSFDEYVLNPHDDESMENIANFFIEQIRDEGWGESYYVPCALSFVQSLPYKSDNLTTGYDEYPRYPVETLVDEGGDCEDKSILFASIVKEMGYGVALLLLEDDAHMAVGVLISQSFVDNWDEYYPLTYYTDSNGDIYAYCETTYIYWGFGEIPDDLVGTAEIIDVF